MIFEENFMICCFNPSHHTGSDPEICFQLAAFRVSIHAPYAGSDDIPCVVLHKNREFQSTLPRRERPSMTILMILRRSFNPRSHAGSDGFQVGDIVPLYVVSIHAPTQGATGRRC